MRKENEKPENFKRKARELTQFNLHCLARTYDALGNLISSTDPGGTTTYSLRPDGKPSSIIAPGNVKTTFTYDTFGRETQMNDPSHGLTSYKYNLAGCLQEEINADGKRTQYMYDLYNRLEKRINPEFTTTYTYNTYGELSNVSSGNGTSKLFTYDDFGRVLMQKETADNIWLQKNYSYSEGNISSIKYTSHSGELATENFAYSNGHLYEVKLNEGITIYELIDENSFGQETESLTGVITRKYTYSTHGLPIGRNATTGVKVCQNHSYSFDAVTNNLLSRKDNYYGVTESFNYDNLNRLTSCNKHSIVYDALGNITGKSDLGVLKYENIQKPYTASGMELTSTRMPIRNQHVEYTSFKRPNSISENDFLATFTYNSQYDRVKMKLTKNNAEELTRYYLGNCYEVDKTASGTKEKLYLSGDYYTAPAVYIKDSSGEKLYYILRDYLGSITQVVSENGVSVQYLSYDALGNLRNPRTNEAYNIDEEPSLFLGRGYTGHEHLPQFGLVNMNARLYEPAFGRFLAPDPFVAMADFSQSFNRYAYALNNPLRYIDRDGQNPFAIIIPIAVAAIGAYIGGVSANHGELNPFAWDYGSFSTYLGIIAGGIMGYATGYAIMNPGTFVFAFGVNTPYLALAGSVYTLGDGTDWKFNFKWSTPAGGGGSVGPGKSPETATNQAIEKARLDYSAYMYASTSLVLLADDVTVVGVLDDILIPIAYGVATYQFVIDNKDLIEKKAREIEGIMKRNLPERDGFVYELKARTNGYYENVRGGMVYLKAGDVWKYGQTVRGEERYTENYLKSKNVSMYPIFYGSQTEILVQEKIMIYGYYSKHGTLPPGNKIFR